MAVAVGGVQARESEACMTDMAAATAALAGCEGAEAAAAREEALGLFYERHARGNDLLLCKWLSIQARPARPRRGVVVGGVRRPRPRTGRAPYRPGSRTGLWAGPVSGLARHARAHVSQSVSARESSTPPPLPCARPVSAAAAAAAAAAEGGLCGRRGA